MSADLAVWLGDESAAVHDIKAGERLLALAIDGLDFYVIALEADGALEQTAYDPIEVTLAAPCTDPRCGCNNEPFLLERHFLRRVNT
jgi:hypothetical protein